MITKTSHSLSKELFWLMIGTIFLNVLNVSIRLSSQFKWYNSLADFTEKVVCVLFFSCF